MAGGRLQAGAADRTEAAARSEREYERRRAVYVDFFTTLEAYRATADGMNSSGRSSASALKEVGLSASRAVSTARLLAPPETWRQIEPYQRAVILKANYHNSRALGMTTLQHEALEALRALDAETEDGWGRLEETARSAVVQDLQSIR